MAEIPVPTIHLDSPTVVAEVQDACARCGFFLLRAHGVPPAITAAAWAAAREFFDQPLPLKAEVAMSDAYPYGYGGMATEKAGNAGGAGALDTTDLKESFQVCLSSAQRPAAVPAVQWPRAPPALPAALTAYYREMEQLAARLLAVFASALALPPDFFPSKMASHWSVVRALNYPEQARAPNPGQLRIAPHSDYGVLTILRADDAPGGLEVLRADGSWSAVVIPEDAFCINLGDLMQRWTNDQWRSTVHRVVNPPPAPGVPTRRQSMAYFCNLDREATVEVIPSSVTAASPAKYPPINGESVCPQHARRIPPLASHHPSTFPPFFPPSFCAPHGAARAGHWCSKGLWLSGG